MTGYYTINPKEYPIIMAGTNCYKYNEKWFKGSIYGVYTDLVTSG